MVNDFEIGFDELETRREYNYDKIVSCYEVLIIGWMELGGENHFNVLDHVTSLGEVFEGRGDFQSAVREFERAFKGYTCLYGSDHDVTKGVEQKLFNIRSKF